MSENKKRIIINGFYGAGNSGDEAMLRNFYYHIKRRLPESEILVATENARGVWEAEDLHYISQHDRAQAKYCDLLVVGGGGLGVGYGWSLMATAKTNHKKTPKIAIVGCSFTDEWLFPQLKDASREMFKLCDSIYVRENKSAELLRQLGLNINVGTDIAIDLPEKHIERNWNEDYVVLVIREVGQNLSLHMTTLALLVLAYLKENHNVIILPFCKEDNTFVNKLNLDVPIVYTDNPQQHKFIINRAKAVVSIGRYHPLVYATEQGIPTIALSWPAGGQKINNWMDYLGNTHNCVYQIDKTSKTSIYTQRLELFIDKFEKLMDNKEIYRKKMLKIHEKHVKLNNKQFDDLVSLIK